MVVFTKYTLCYECRQDEKGEVDKVLLHIKTHPGANLSAIAIATGVDSKLILRLIRGGRVEPNVKERGNKKKTR